MFQKSDETFEKILVNMLDPKDAATKTEIHNPLGLAKLASLADALEAEGLDLPAKTIRSFIDHYLIYMISHDRKSRTEIIQALSEAFKRERSMAEKLTSAPQ